MSGRAGVIVLSASELVRVEVIDGGHTVVLRLKAPGGEEFAVLLPRQVAADVKRGLAGVGCDERKGPP